MNLNDKQKIKIAQSVTLIAFALAALAAAVHFTDSREAETQAELVEVETETGKKMLTEAMLAVTNEMAEKYSGIDMEAETEAAVETQEEESTETVDTVDTQDIVDEYDYAAATPMTKEIVEEYASSVCSLFLQHNWSSLAGLIEFPITIDDITYDTRESFMQGGLDDIYSEDFMSDIEAEDCVDIYCSSSTGIWLGGYDNNVMIADVGDDEISELKIVSVSGLIDEDKLAAKNKSWARAYYDFVVDTYDDSYVYSYDYNGYEIVNGFSLIYLDDDDIPELVVDNNFWLNEFTGECYIYAYYQGQVKEVLEYYYGGVGNGCLSYAPFSGWICEEGYIDPYATYVCEFFMLNEKCELEYMGNETRYSWYDTNGNGTFDEGDEYPSEYDRMETEGILPSDDLEWEVVHWLDYMSYTEILSQLCEAGNF